MGRPRNKLIAIRGLDSTVPGPKGDSAYPYIAYATAIDGSGFTMVNNATYEYVAILITTIEIVSPVVADFTGLWFKRSGASVDILQVQVFS